MKEKIYKYIHKRNRNVSTQEIVEQFFHVYSNYPPKMEKIVETILKDDARFVRDEIGEWQVHKDVASGSLSNVVFSIIEIESVAIDPKRKIPFALGITQVKNDRLLSHEIYSLELAADISNQLKNNIIQFYENFAAPAFIDHIETIFMSLENTIIVSDSPDRIMGLINYFFRSRIGSELETETISIGILARVLIPGIKIRSIEDIAASLSISFHSPLDLKGRLDLIAEILFSLLQELKQSNIETLAELIAFIDSAKTWIDFSGYNFNQDFIKNLPTTPGVYFMRDEQGKVFYVGKAKNLRSRVESYFVNRFDMDEKGKAILKRIFDLNYEVVGSELEALLLENQYINEFQPDLNVQIKIHPMDFSEYQRRQMILFLPGTTEDEIHCFLIEGVSRMGRFTISRAKPDSKALKQELQAFFFELLTKNSSFSTDQIEIFWRWFAVHQEKVNFIDLATCGNLEECLELVKKYCGDEQLFLDKMDYR